MASLRDAAADVCLNLDRTRLEGATFEALVCIEKRRFRPVLRELRARTQHVRRVGEQDVLLSDGAKLSRWKPLGTNVRLWVYKEELDTVVLAHSVDRIQR